MFVFLFEFVDTDGLLACRLVNRNNLKLVTTFLNQLQDVAPPRHRKFVLKRKIECLRANNGSIKDCIHKNRHLVRIFRNQCQEYKSYNAVHTCIMCYRYNLMLQQFSLHVPYICFRCEHKYYCSACKTKPTLLDRCLSCVVKGQFFAPPFFKVEPGSCSVNVLRLEEPHA